VAKIRNIKNYYLTEIVFEPPVDLNEVHDFIRRSRANAELVGIFSNGGVQGITMKQRTHILSTEDSKVREILGIKDIEI